MRKIFAVLLPVTLIGCGTMPDYYYSTLEDNTPNETKSDSFHPAFINPEEGRSNTGEIPEWISANDIDAPQNRSVQMRLTAPAAWAKNPEGFDLAASMGIFVTDLALDANSKFTLQATFQWPQDEGPPDLITDQQCRDPTVASTTGWTVTLVAREGGRDDAYNLSRIQLSFKSTGSSVDMRVQQIDGRVPDQSANTTLVIPMKLQITPEDHRKLFCSGEPFTLKLDVNRANGTGTATIEGAGLSYPPLPITLTGQFAAGTGPTLTAAGVALANGISPGETVSVRVKDLKIWKN